VYRAECIVRFPKYSSVPLPYCELVRLPARGVARWSDEPNACVWRSRRVSEVGESLAAMLSEGECDSRPNLEGTEDGHGPPG
jgi:hypothetical protein